MKFKDTETSEGLKAALAIEACGGWRDFDPDKHMASITNEAVEAAKSEISHYQGPGDMPPDPRHLRLLVDAAAYLHKETTRAAGWDINGIQPTAGRRLLNGSREIFWSVFFTAYSFGMGHAEFERPEDYQIREELPA
jgi:hypothetical protein